MVADSMPIRFCLKQDFHFQNSQAKSMMLVLASFLAKLGNGQLWGVCVTFLRTNISSVLDL